MDAPGLPGQQPGEETTLGVDPYEVDLASV
jgi:hypothetical protein